MSKPLLSATFVIFVATLDPRERVLTPARRAESLQEFFANRSSK